MGPRMVNWTATQLPVIDFFDGPEPTRSRWVPGLRSIKWPDEIAYYLVYTPIGIATVRPPVRRQPGQAARARGDAHWDLPHSPGAHPNQTHRNHRPAGRKSLPGFRIPTWSKAVRIRRRPGRPLPLANQRRDRTRTPSSSAVLSVPSTRARASPGRPALPLCCPRCRGRPSRRAGARPGPRGH